MEFWGIIENRIVALCYLLPQPKNGWFIIITNDLVMENHHFQCLYHLLQISISSKIYKSVMFLFESIAMFESQKVLVVEWLEPLLHHSLGWSISETHTHF